MRVHAVGRSVASIAVLGTLIGTPSVFADPSAPDGWAHNDADSLRRTATAQAERHLGTDAASVRIDGWTAPDRRSTLWITRVEAPVANADRDRIASAFLAELQAAARRNDALIDASTQRWDPQARHLEATISWRNPTLGIRQLARAVIAGDATQLYATTAECILPVPADPAIERACGAAIDRLVATGASIVAVPLAIVAAPLEPTTTTPDSAAPTAPPTTAPASPLPRTGMRDLDAPRIGEGPPGRIATTKPPPPTRDRRPIYLGVGIIVLAALFWWNRQRRERFEREPDDDANDLHAAARDDAPKDEP